MTQHKEIDQKYYIYNGVIRSTEEFEHDAILKSPSVYEVIRVIDAVPLFLEEHLNRLNNSIALLGNSNSYEIDTDKLKLQINQLLDANGRPEQNFKIIVNNLETEAPDIYLFFISSHYPSIKQYQKGVSTILYSAMRKNPNIKAVSTSQREMINAALKDSNVYEAILVNENKEITEGSRSNIFIVKSGVIYTAPAKDVLIGITRERVMGLCRKLNVPVVEQPISIEFLLNCEGLIITGTSPKILPISSIDNQQFNSPNHPLILQLMKSYDELIQEYITLYTT
ncbi:aminotransferase class IV [Alkaliphilus hydrothermalis]|uniref:Branched-chain amino acid aminotransferase n=1 Tax=Alkaliphilus hydrothermalis TaxID=1482730 RepID=A0ABS2NRI7_9FIRM|nr:aminotransferase class IV [Alkaliphilus hydrothermalis]MBM7615392.1 branched-chain amino acid aminotransferase [Alkaliphilus hydrothermalis]